MSYKDKLFSSNKVKSSINNIIHTKTKEQVYKKKITSSLYFKPVYNKNKKNYNTLVKKLLYKKIHNASKYNSENYYKYTSFLSNTYKPTLKKK